jgi:hypothetical protein
MHDLFADFIREFDRRLSARAISIEAEQRAYQLLRENLTPIQREQYDRCGHFDVTGGVTGRRYRIQHGCLSNVQQLGRDGRRICGWCFYPRGALAVCDVMLAQKFALELFEKDALAVAIRRRD